MVPSLMRWQSGCASRMANRTFNEPTTLFTCGEYGMFPVDHGEGSGALFGKMDDCLGLKLLNRGEQKVVIRHITNKELNASSGQARPGSESIGKRENGSKSLGAKFVVPLTANKIIDNSDGVALCREVKGSRPSTIAIPAQNNDFHGFLSRLASIYSPFAMHFSPAN